MTDGLEIPQNPEPLNDIEIRSRGRVITIDEYYKLDKYNRIEKVLYSVPKPELGQTFCKMVKRPKHLDKGYYYRCY